MKNKFLLEVEWTQPEKEGYPSYLRFRGLLSEAVLGSVWPGFGPFVPCYGAVMQAERGKQPIPLLSSPANVFTTEEAAKKWVEKEFEKYCREKGIKSISAEESLPSRKATGMTISEAVTLAVAGKKIRSSTTCQFDAYVYYDSGKLWWHSDGMTDSLFEPDSEQLIATDWEVVEPLPKSATFTEVLAALEAGKRVKRPHWASWCKQECDLLVRCDDGHYVSLCLADWKATDWVISE